MNALTLQSQKQENEVVCNIDITVSTSSSSFPSDCMNESPELNVVLNESDEFSNEDLNEITTLQSWNDLSVVNEVNVISETKASNPSPTNSIHNSQLKDTARNLISWPKTNLNTRTNRISLRNGCGKRIIVNHTPRPKCPGTRKTPANTTNHKTKDIPTHILSFLANLKIETPAIHDFSKLNKTDINELEQHQHLLSVSQVNMLTTLKKKQETFPKRYRGQEYLRHSLLLLLSSGWKEADKYMLCGIKNLVCRSGLCKRHKFCPYCNFLERQEKLARYVPVFHSGIWFSLTGSYTGHLNLTSNQDYADLNAYWDGYRNAFKQLLEGDLIRGAFWSEELAINRFSPNHALPHIHAILEADSLSSGTIEILRQALIANLRANLGPDHLAPNIESKPIDSQKKLYGHIHYAIKPINVLKAYDAAWSGAVHNDRQGAVKLNSYVTDLVVGYSMATTGRRTLNAIGNLIPSAKKRYIGTKVKEMKSAYKFIREFVSNGLEYAPDQDANPEN